MLDDMQHHRLSLFTAALCAAVFANAGAATPSARTESGAASKPALIAAAGPEAALTRGMSADEVTKFMNAPAQIKSMEAPNGKAEVWVYRRRIEVGAERVQTSSGQTAVTVVDANGSLRTQLVGPDAEYRTQHRIVEETVELLMFNNHFLKAKVSRVEKREFD